MKRKFTKLIAALALLVFMTPSMVGWGQSSTWSHEFVSGDSYTNNSVTVNGVTWAISTSQPVGTPSISFGNMQKKYALKFGSSGTNYFPTITLTTDYFTNYNVQSVTVNICNNGSKEGTLTVVQGSTTIGTDSKTFGQTWTDLTANTNTGSGGQLSISYTVAQACGIHSITVTYSTGSSATATNTTITIPTNFNTDVYTSTTAGTLTASVTETASGNVVSGATVTWASSNTSVATVDQNGAVTLEAAGTTNITATYAGDNTYAGSVGTYQLNVINSDPNVPGTANNPYTVADIIAMGSSLPSGTVYVSGIVSRFHGDHILDDGTNYRYFISNDGAETDEIRVYKGNGLNNQAFANADDVLIGDHVVICGELSIYSNMTQFNAGNYIYSLTRPASYTLTVSSLSHAEMFVFAGNDSEVLFEGEGSGSVVEGASVILSVEPENGYELASLMVDGVEHVNDINGGAYVFNMPPHDVVVTVSTTRLPYYTVNFTTNGIVDCSIEVTQGQSIATLPTATAEYIPNGYTFVGWYTTDYQDAGVAPQFVTAPYTPNADVTLKAVFAVATGTPASLTKMTSSDNFTAGDNVVIVAVGEDYAFAMYQQTKSNSYVDKYEFDGNVATVAANDKNWLTVSAGSTSDTWILGDATNGYVYTGSSNDLEVNTESSTDFTLAWNSDQNKFTLAGNNRYLSYRYDLTNKYFRMGGANLGTSGNVYFDIYKYVAGSTSYSDYKTSLTQQHLLNVVGYSGDGGYRLIASPVYVSPSTVTGMTDGNFDLYYFDQNETDEWRNYKVGSFNLEPGKGYLYAKEATTGNSQYTFSLVGTPYSGNGQITLSKVDGADWEGWNLIGNPFASGMLLKDANNDNKAFYTLNPAGNELMAGTAGTEIAAMEGVFVEATTDGEEVSFVEETGGGGAGGGGFDFISLNVSRNRGASAGSATIDRAIIGIGDGPMLHKFQLNPSNTKIYITEANQDYAIVRSANEAELPVSFRASENGTYTISVETKNVEMNYLHLIDNMTGADVDLLATPNYTFEAKTSDYASRFRLVFSASFISEDADGDNAFAYFNGSNWTVSNMGEATLQVVDVMGRVLSSETLSGNAEVNINQPTGVYMLRLVSGDNVKVQKVVVR